MDQDFESESLARYQATRASTFTNFAPLQEQDAGQAFEAMPNPDVLNKAGNGMSMPTGRFTAPRGGRFTAPLNGRGGGRFTFPGGGRFSQPGGRFTFPKGFDPGVNRFSFPAGGDLRADRMSMPASPENRGGRFTWPQARFTMPQNNTRQRIGNPGGFTQPAGRFTSPSVNKGRFTYPSEG